MKGGGSKGKRGRRRERGTEGEGRRSKGKGQVKGGERKWERKGDPTLL